MTDAQRRVLAFINKHPRLLAALYDLGLTPEETLRKGVGERLAPFRVRAPGGDEWPLTVRVAVLYAQAAGLEPWWLVAEANATRRQASPAWLRALEHSPESPAARARQRARETGEAPPSCAWTDEAPPCSCLDAAPLMTMRDAPGNDAAAEAFVRATTPASADPLIRDHDADAYLGAGAVYVPGDPDSWAERNPIFELPPPMMRARAYRSPAAAADEARVSERASCAAIAAQVEHEALGSPIAQDTARRIRDAILALR